MTVKQLITELQKYEEGTKVCAGRITQVGIEHYDLLIKESNPIGDRDAEKELLLWIGYEDQ
jgi:hypothetical protein